MSDFFHIQPHDSIEDLEFCYHRAKCAVYSRHLQIVILVRKGWTTSQIAEITTLTKGWISTICKRYNQGGKEALRDSREKNSGRPRLLSDEEMETIKKSFNNLPLIAAFGPDPKLPSSSEPCFHTSRLEKTLDILF